MIVGDPKKEHEFVSNEDSQRPTDEQTIFLLRQLTAREAADVADDISNYDTEGNFRGVKLGSNTLKILAFGLKGWRNLKRDDGASIEPVKDQQGKVSDESLDYIPNLIRQEIKNEIMRITNLSQAEIKNSD